MGSNAGPHTGSSVCPSAGGQHWSLPRGPTVGVSVPTGKGLSQTAGSNAGSHTGRARALREQAAAQATLSAALDRDHKAFLPICVTGASGQGGLALTPRTSKEQGTGERDGVSKPSPVRVTLKCSTTQTGDVRQTCKMTTYRRFRNKQAKVRESGQAVPSGLFPDL